MPNGIRVIITAFVYCNENKIRRKHIQHVVDMADKRGMLLASLVAGPDPP